MNSNLYDCCCNCNTDCNNSNNKCTSNPCQALTACNDPIANSIKNIEDSLCDMKVCLAETKTALLFLAQTLCNEGNLCSTEKSLLLSIEQSLKCLNRSVNESKTNLENLQCLLR